MWDNVTLLWYLLGTRLRGRVRRSENLKRLKVGSYRGLRGDLGVQG